MSATTAPSVRELLAEVALERELRHSTYLSYKRLLGRVIDLDSLASEVSALTLMPKLNALPTNSRRATIVAVRAVFGFKIKIPKAVPRVYMLPDEDTLRLALMTSPRELRGLLMMYGAARVSEACYITRDSICGPDALLIENQVSELHETGQPLSLTHQPVKSESSVRVITVPEWLVSRVRSLETRDKPSIIRESLRRSGKRVGIDLTPHMLRHWWATEALSRGVDIKTVSLQLGHSDIAVTLRAYVQGDRTKIRKTFG